jgi:hypothetical protein
LIRAEGADDVRNFRHASTSFPHNSEYQTILP